MSNKASKKDAVRIIQTAVREGFKREIDTMRDLNGSVWSVQVSLTRSIYFANGYHNYSGHIIVSFRKARRGWSVSIATGNLDGGKIFRGVWNAHYVLKNMRETFQRQVALDAQKEVA